MKFSEFSVNILVIYDPSPSFPNVQLLNVSNSEAFTILLDLKLTYHLPAKNEADRESQIY